MDSAQEILIPIALASQRVIDALAASSRDRNDQGHETPRRQLRGDLQRIIVASQTLLAEILQHSPSAGSAVDDRLENWLSGNEPQICLDTLQEMETLIQSSSTGVTSMLCNLFRSEDILEQVVRIFQKRRDCFYFLLNTNIWNRETATTGQPGNSSITQSIKRGFVNRNTNVVERAWKKKIWSETDHTQLTEILEWLDAWDCTEKQEDTLELRQPATCTWLFDTDEYQTWRNGSDAFLWLHGKPGSGKSVLAASVIDNIRNKKDEGELLAIFYCDFRSGRSTVAAEVMRSLLSQLLQGLSDLGLDHGGILDVLAKERRQKRSILCNAKRLAPLVCRSAEQFPQLPLVVVDALDECEDKENLLDSLLVLKEGRIRLFVVSRPLQVIKDKFSCLPWLSLEQMSIEVSADIRLHVQREVDSHRRLRIAGVELKEEIIDTLCNRADGMFRWIECQLNTLKRCFTTVEIREALDSLPIGLEATYEQILLAIGKEERGGAIAQHTLVWLVAALRPLQLCQIIETLSIDVDHQTLNPDAAPIHGSALLDSLGSLVIYYEETDIVKLSHFSVKEYLVGSSTHENHKYHIDEPDAHAQLARQCMSYIAACLKLRREVSYDEHPLLEYVWFCGFDHLADVKPTKSILDAVVTLDSNIQEYRYEWTQMQDYLKLKRPYPPHSSILKLRSPEHDFVLYILIRFAPEPLLRLFLTDTPLTQKEGINPLAYAVPGKDEHARTLLLYGAKLHLNHLSETFIRMYDFPYGLPIEFAARTRDHVLVHLFLEEGTPVPHKIFSVSLLEERAHFMSSHVFTKLLQTDEFMEWAMLVSNEKLLTLLTPVLDGMVFLHRDMDSTESVSGDVIDIARRLKQIGCDLTGHSPFTEALLRCALGAREISSVRYLLSDLNMQIPPDILLDEGGSDAEMTRFLIDNGASIHSVSADESNALHFTLETFWEDEYLDNTELLCEAGCDPSACNLKDETPIHIAVKHNRLPAVKHLLSIGVALPTDILLAEEEGLSSSMIHFLLRQGADARVIAANGDNALHLVLRHLTSDNVPVDSLGCTKMLVAASCDPALTNSSGQTPLDVAVASRYISVVKYLLSEPLHLQFSPDIFLTACSESCVCSTNFPAMIRILLSHGADPHVTMPNGDSALHLAVEYNWLRSGSSRLQVVKTLVAAGCDPSARNTEGQTVLHRAARQGNLNIKVIEYLLSRGASLPPDILLHVDYLQATTQVIQFLIDKGADPRAVSPTGDTPLHRAVTSVPLPGTESLSLKFAKLLITAGSKPCAFNEAHETPMHKAAGGGCVSVIDYLLSLDVPLPPDILLAPFSGCFPGSVVTSPVVRFLISKGADITAVTPRGDTGLHLAMASALRDDRLETTKILVEAGCDIHACNSAGETPLYVAARMGHINIIEYLLSQDASLPHDVFLAAARGGHIYVMEYLLSRGALVPPDSFLAAASADEFGLKKSRTLQFLATLDGADLGIVAPNGDTVLHHVVECTSDEQECLKTVKLLVHLGYDSSARNLAGETPLHISARQRYISVLKYLLSKGEPLPSNVLLCAASGCAHGFPQNNYLGSQAIATMRFLIREGADPNVVDDKGDTPLHILLRSDVGNRMPGWKAIQMLLDAGASPHARNLDGETPISLAEQVGPFFTNNFMRLVKEAANAPNALGRN